jgi:hypothetical protein
VLGLKVSIQALSQVKYKIVELHMKLDDIDYHLSMSHTDAVSSLSGIPPGVPYTGSAYLVLNIPLFGGGYSLGRDFLDAVPFLFPLLV